MGFSKLIHVHVIYMYIHTGAYITCTIKLQIYQTSASFLNGKNNHFTFNLLDSTNVRNIKKNRQFKLEV